MGAIPCTRLVLDSKASWPTSWIHTSSGTGNPTSFLDELLIFPCPLLLSSVCRWSCLHELAQNHSLEAWIEGINRAMESRFKHRFVILWPVILFVAIMQLHTCQRTIAVDARPTCLSQKVAQPPKAFVSVPPCKVRQPLEYPVYIRTFIIIPLTLLGLLCRC